MRPLSVLRRAQLVELAHRAGVARAGKRRRQELVKILLALDLRSLRKEQLYAMARYLGMKAMSKASKKILVERLRREFAQKEEAEVKTAGRGLTARELDELVRAQWLGSSPSVVAERLTDNVVRQDVPQELIREQLDVMQIKFTPTIRHELLIDQDAQLPDSYGSNRAALLVRDPNWLFVYWEVTQDRIDWARSQGARTPLLRVYDVTDLGGSESWHSYFDVYRGEEARAWHIYVPVAGRAYVIEVGYVNGRGQFLPLLRSNRVETPAARISPLIEDRFATIPFDQPLGELARQRKLRTRETIEAAVRSTRVHLKMTRLSLPPVCQPAVSDRTGAVKGLAPEGGAAWSRVEMLASVPEARLRWFRLERDLVVSGRTAPDAMVFINGESVDLDASGNFWFRIPFPAGRQVHPVVAYSCEKKGREEILIQFSQPSS
ncbi:MAG: DUF4912 domain-containing protein [Acidobacteria bacterium]|nr:DUF4912 domain-containing protein [Acidobacteriota bacterium]